MMGTIVAFGSLFLLAAAIGAQADPQVRIQSRFYSVTWDQSRGSFAVQKKPSGKLVLTSGKLGTDGGTARKVAVTDKTFGAGDSIEVAYPNGSRDSIALYPNLPFVLFISIRHNGGADPVVLNHIPTVSAVVDLGKPAAALRTLGTGGLRTPAQNPGSYAFLAVADPESRAGVVGGWVTNDRGSGVVFSPVEGDSVRLQAQVDYGKLRIQPGQDTALETFALGCFDDARFGLEAYADAIARVYAIKLPPQPAGFCTWYMDKHGAACDETHLAELSAVAAKELEPFGFDFVQIDDNWQAGVSNNGPKRNFSTHAPNGPYPSGMKATADTIKKLGLTPGIWFMPFAGTYYDPYFADHQDWFVKGPDGKPYETAWGGTCLDMTDPGAREHLRSVVDRIAHEWGYTLFKMDGLWTGTATKQVYVNDGYTDDLIGETTFHNPDKTNIEAYRDGLKLVRKTAGPGVYLLGCCVSQNMRSFGGAFGLLDGMRIGPDTGGHIGAPHGSRLWFLNGRVWHNDPDCVFVRASMPLNEALLNASWAAISGQLFYDSDWMPDLPADRLNILKRCMPAHGLPARPVDVFEAEPARIWLLTDNRGTRRDVVALYNWSNKQATVSCSPERIGLPPANQYVAFDFWANAFVPPFSGSVMADLPGSSCRVLAIRPVTAYPQLLSTSRHITQGIVDVSGEKWDARTRTLSGTSRIVGGDPYELRIVVPVGEKSWRVAEITAAGGDVKSEMKQDGPKIRATLTSPISGDVHWQVRFVPARVDAPAPQPVANLKVNAEYQAVTLTWDSSGADAYRVTRSDGATFDTGHPSLTDVSIGHGKEYRYSVAARGWGGTQSSPAAVDVTTPAELKRPAVPPAPGVYLNVLKAVQLTSGWGEPQINKSVQGNPLNIDGKTYAKGLGVHAESLAVYTIPAGARRFVSVVGLDDEVRQDPRSSVVFEVWGDVKEMGETPVLLGKSPVLCDKTLRSWAFDLEINSRFKELRLVVTDAGDGIAADHADWADAGFVTG